MSIRFGLLFVCLGIASAAKADEVQTVLRGEVRDAESQQLVPCRLYVNSADGAKWFFPKSADPNGSAIVYDRAREKSIEKHVTLSAHRFVVELPPGKYVLTAERGKEYLTATKEIEVGKEPVTVTLELKRWINMAEHGWYSGDTHVHRVIAELPNVILAEDLNMVYPMSQWVTVTHTLPEKGRVDPQPIPREPIFADPTHAIVPLNTEYEIFSVGPKRHTLGAVLVLGQKEPLKLGIPPIKAVAEEARRQGALLDLEKHSWAWTPIIAPVMKADLYPLSNNHVWRTEFAFKQWTLENNWRDNPRIDTDKDGFTESGWLHYGWEQYYAMLNCGLRMRPTAGTANAVHPVPAGFSRVYVNLGNEKFTPELWQKRLNEGRSFVTTGPMLFVTTDNDQPFGFHRRVKPMRIGTQDTISIQGRIVSQHRIDRIEFVDSTGVRNVVRPDKFEHAGKTFEYDFSDKFAIDGSTWFVVRCFEKLPNGRERFAHTAPTFVDYEDSPLRPRRDQVRYLIQRCEEEVARCKDVLGETELAEYREALEFYRGKLATAR